MPLMTYEGGGPPPAEPLSPKTWLWLQVAAQQVVDQWTAWQQAFEASVKENPAQPYQVPAWPQPLPGPEQPPEGAPEGDETDERPPRYRTPLPPPSLLPDIGELLSAYGMPEVATGELRAYGTAYARFLYSDISADGDYSDDIGELLDAFGGSESSLLIALRDQPDLVEAVLEMSNSPEAAIGILFAYEQSPQIVERLLARYYDDNTILELPDPFMLELPGDYSVGGSPSVVMPPQTSQEAIGRLVQAIAQAYMLEQDYGVTLTTEAGYPYAGGYEGLTAWLMKPERVNEVYQAVMGMTVAFQQVMDNSSSPDMRLRLAPYIPGNITGAELFRLLSGSIELRLVNDFLGDDTGPAAEVQSGRLIHFLPISRGQFISSRYNIVHEFGHIIDARTGTSYARTYTEQEIGSLGQLTDFVEATSCRPHNINSGLCRQNLSAVNYEEWADRFLFWVYDGIKEITDSREERRLGFAEPSIKYQVDQWMADVISMAYGHSVSGDEVLMETARSVIGYEPSFNPPVGEVKTEGDRLNLHESPTRAGKILEGIADGTSISVLGVDRTGMWLLAVYDDFIGWVSRKYVEIDSTSDLREVDQETMERLTAIGYDSNWNRIPAGFPPPSDMLP
jgi:hypothetical protein